MNIELQQDLQTSETHTIGEFPNAHTFLKDNEFIHSGYRINFSTTKRILKSLFMCHNESVNIWTHLIGLFVFLFLLWYSIEFLDIAESLGIQLNRIQLLQILREAFSNSWYYGLSTWELLSNRVHAFMEDWEKEVLYSIESQASMLSAGDIKEIVSQKMEEYRLFVIQKIDMRDYFFFGLQNDFANPEHYLSRWPIYVFVVSAMICLFCSSFYHLFCAHSYKVYKISSTLDYAGISILIAGSFYPVIYYIYYCHEGNLHIELVIAYLVGISVCALGVFFSSFTPCFHKPKWRWVRGITFLMLGLLGLIPCLNLFFIPEALDFATSLLYYMGMALCYVIGVMIYIFRIPERFWPGKLDFVGNSHNIWHCFVLAAAIIHYLGSIDSYYIRQNLTC